MASPSIPEFFKSSNPNIRLPPTHKFSNDNQSVRPPLTNAYNSSFSMAPEQVIAGPPRYSYSPAAQLFPNISRSKVTAVIPYPTENGLEQAPTNAIYKTQNQQIQQRIIMDEPQAFSQRIQYNNAYQTKTPVFQSFQQQKPTITVPIQENLVPQTVDIKPSTVVYENLSNPLVQTIQGNWYEENQIAKNSFAPPAPAPRDAKTCCSPWILALIGVVALAALLITILVGKQTSSGSQVSVTQTVPVANVSSVSPIPLKTSPQTPSFAQGPVSSTLSVNSPNAAVQGTTSVTPLLSSTSNNTQIIKNPPSTPPSPTTIVSKAAITTPSATVSIPIGNQSVANQTSSSSALPPNSIPALEV